MCFDYPTLTLLSAIWAMLAVLAFAMSFKVRDITGRIGGAGRGKHIDARWGWFWMELPALVTFPSVYFASGNLHLVGNIAVALWLAHYGHRTLVWPLVVLRPGATIPSGMWMSGGAFNVTYGALLGSYLAFAPQLGDAWLSDPRFLAGVVLMIGGAWLNLWSDYRLLALRRRSGHQRVLPEGGAFNLSCCPNLLGEIIEWLGFALLTWCLPALAFALWSIANLVPRALWRRSWYHTNFPDFPRTRAALIPGLL